MGVFVADGVDAHTCPWFKRGSAMAELNGSADVAIAGCYSGPTNNSYVLPPIGQQKTSLQ